MAIRAPMMKEPEAATDVFAIDTRGSSAATADGVVWHSGFPVDLAIQKNVTGVSSPAAYDRFRGSYSLFTDTTAAEQNQGGHKFDSMNGFDVRTLSAATNQLAWMWKRAKGYMDAVAYSGTGSATTVAHSLSVIPEMMWLKQRGQAENWQVYNSASGNTKTMRLNMSVASYTSTSFNNTTPTSTAFSVDNSNAVNGSGRTYIALLFATLPGISKVGSFVGNGTTQTIDCGFSAGARFLLIKGSTNTENWYVFDSVRGIVARPAGQPFSPYAYGLDAKLQWDNTSAQFINVDFIDPHNSGFIVNAGAEVNGSGVSYIFYAIA